MILKTADKLPANAEHVCYFLRADSTGKFPSALKSQTEYLNKKKKEKGHQLLRFIEGKVHVVVALINTDKKDSISTRNEKLRKLGNDLGHKFKAEKAEEIFLVNEGGNLSSDFYIDVLEGLILGSYRFDKYKSKKNKHTIKSVRLVGDSPGNASLKELNNVCESVTMARDLINEPVMFMNAPQLGKEIAKIGKKSGFSVQILNKADIIKHKMGGLLGVNLGSIDPPIFAILEWKPAKAKNTKPYVLVGKGVVYDTGGYSLKTGNFMPTMKCDMSGAAAVVGAINAVTRNKLPIHVIGLIPATDNRLTGNALVPDDVITISDGTTVEVLNTDAEGRLILADALVWARKYKPQLVIDLATLTGSASNFTGTLGSAMMGNSPEDMTDLKESGDVVYERLAEFPFWKEYGDMLKSKVADLKNIGGPIGGAITAGKFLEHFTDYPWIHLDIAGPAFIDHDENYKPAGGTGVGVRLLYHYLQSKTRKK